MQHSERTASYLVHAADCVRLAAHVSDPVHKAELRQMAQAWLALAEHAETRATQQQQQPQPKDD